MDQDVKVLFRTSFRWKTKVRLPNEQIFDTHSISKNNDFHSKNNYLTAQVSTSSRGPHPGMNDHLRPDYSNLSQDFHDAALSGRTFASNIMHGITRTADHSTVEVPQFHQQHQMW